MNTVDWSRWMELSDEQREALRRQYRDIVKTESDEARRTNYARMDAAIKAAGRSA